MIPRARSRSIVLAVAFSIAVATGISTIGFLVHDAPGAALVCGVLAVLALTAGVVVLARRR